MSLVQANVPASAVAPVTAATIGGPVTLREELETWQGAFELAKVLAPTEFVPKGMRNNPPAVMACILKAAELGVSALHGLSQIFVIDGRPGLYAELMRAMILSKGHQVWTEDYTSTMVTLCGQRRDGQHVQKVTWTMDDARRARLDGKPVWRQYPRSMLLARATGELGRLMFADVLAGMSYTVEELSDGLEPPDALVAAGPESAPDRPATTRRTTKDRRRRGTVPAPVSEEESDPTGEQPPPGGSPPPLPGEADDTLPGAPQDAPPADGPVSGSPDTPSRPGGGNVGPTAGEPDEPAEVVDRRAQAIAMRARTTGVDHHDVVDAVTSGGTRSAKDLDAATAGAVLQAIVDIGAGRLRLAQGDDGEWLIVSTRDPDETAPADDDEAPADLQDRLQRVREAQRGGQQALPTEER